MPSECLEPIFDDLTSVCGSFNAGRCFDDVWPWAAGGAVGGAATGVGAVLGAVGGGGAAALTSPNCGDGSRSPATMLRESLTQGASTYTETPIDQQWPLP